MTAHAGPYRGHVERTERSAVARVVLGRRTDPQWVRPSLWALLVVTALLYVVDLSASGTANSFYAAAVQAGSKSWKAMFFGSLDSSNFITVDKPPASLWVMDLSARIFGFSSWSLLVPQALEGVASVLIVFATVRRTLAILGARLAAAGGLLAGAALAFTPAAALMFRFDNPDALLVMLMSLAAYFTVRALPRASWKWLAAAGLVLGFAFLTKMLQGLLVAPAFALVYLLAAPTGVWRRLLHVLGAMAGVVVGAGWWVATVALWPADARPYIGGSTDNSVLQLAFGYNGLGRFFGSGAGNGGGGGMGGTAGSSFGGSTGLTRLFSSEMGLEISWLLPAALLFTVLGIVVAGRRSRVDLVRAGFVMQGAWLVVTGLVFSYTSGTIHPYYTVALAPAIAALVGSGGVLLWHRRSSWLGRLGLAVAVAGTGAWSFRLLSENASWLPWLRWVLLAGSIVAALAFVVGSIAAWRRVTLAAALSGALFALGGSGAYALATASVAHSGSIPSVGSTSSSGFGGGGGAGGPGGAGGFGGAGAGSTDSGDTSGAGSTGSRPSGEAPSGEMPSGEMPSGAAPSGSDGAAPSDSDDAAPSGSDGAAPEAPASGSGGSTSSSSTALDTLLKKSTARWAAAVNNDQSAATLELSSGTAIMAIGGWSDDPTPTLSQFEAYVKAGDVGYYIVSGSGMGGGTGGTSTASKIAAWVEAHYTAKTVGGYTVYDLSSPTS
ncbi:glycosyltransferase family 39 protein [Frondihabitans australicus]|uniref:4-amino-4-deoxy-L-arabinose transferase-like glycosyltransferase n=1 Tax=Frondihabitans australicus TaxID=386892 RepID=A0A495ING8_9MICO|nr:glycosyltransferase family 39 protein [Frondihabitans australicus]RKR76706.1 4-amino-4-deoxy-L-arabinose transferase-like glycosyltransferase [Frondihabitans australicus]